MTFFRTLGGSFGASIMGTIYANRLAGVLPQVLVQARVPASQVTSPAAVHQLPLAACAIVVHAYAGGIARRVMLEQQQDLVSDQALA